MNWNFKILKKMKKFKCTVWAFEANRTDGVIQNCQRGFRFNVKTHIKVKIGRRP